MKWKTSDKLFEFEVPLDHQERLIESILETGDLPTPLSQVNWVGHPPINIKDSPNNRIKADWQFRWLHCQPVMRSVQPRKTNDHTSPYVQPWSPVCET